MANRTRFEIEIRKASAPGKLFCRIFDDYWDSIDTGSYETGHPEQIDLRAFRDLRNEIAALKTGWYAIEIADYPFGTASRVFRIPGRHLRYASARN